MTLKHLVELDAQGAVVLPASPGFYAGGSTVRELVDFVAGRVLDAVGVRHELYRRWAGELGAAAKAAGRGSERASAGRVCSLRYPGWSAHGTFDSG